MATYYRSRYLPDPVVYAEDEDGWRSHGPGGVILEASGCLPESLRAHVEEIEPSEGLPVIERRAQEAEEGRRAREEAVRGLMGPVVGRDTPFPVFID